MKVGFDGGIKLEFHGAKLSSNDGLLAYRDLDHALGLFNSVSTVFIDKRTGRNSCLLMIIFSAIYYMYPYIFDSFAGKNLFQLNKYHNLNLLNE